MNTSMMLGLAVLVGAVFLVLFMSGEMKNKSTHSSDGHVAGQASEVARSSLGINSGKKSLFSQLFGNLGVSKGGAFEDVLYAEGGAYESFDVPYGKDEMAHLYANKGGKIEGTDWAKKVPHENTVAKSHTTLGEGHRFASPYGMNRQPFTKTPQHMNPVAKLGEPDLVSNVHTRHPAAAGHHA
jgi:hypothetical protein